MSYSLKSFDVRADEIVEWLTQEFGGIRTGRATPMLLDLVEVESYGARVPLNQVASVNVEDPRTLRINVWDKNTLKAVEKGMSDADLGLSIIVDGNGLRAIFPELTGERRTQLLKLAKAKLEEARVSIRVARDTAMKEIDALEKSGGISEDERFSARQELQKHVDEKNAALESAYKLKELEIQQ